jgi:hypothetical protein
MHQAIPCWPPDVQFQFDTIYDRTLDIAFHLNPTGCFIAAQINGSSCCTEIAKSLERSFALTPDAAIAETTRFLGQLNRRALINFNDEQTERSPILKQTSHLLGILREMMLNPITLARRLLYRNISLWHRTTLYSRSPVRLLIQLVCLVARKMWLAWLVLVVGGFLVLPISLFLVKTSVILSVAGGYVAVLLAATFGIIASIAIHELGHAWMWRTIRRAKGLVIITHRYDLRVICPTRSIHEQKLVALAGPLANGVALALGTPLIVLAKDNLYAQLIIGAFLAPQLLTASSVFFHDGKLIWGK